MEPRMLMGYEPPFRRTPRIDEFVLEIVELVGEFNASSANKPRPWLHRKMRIQTIHSSLAIEGNQLAESVVQEIIDGQKVLGDPKDILEVQNAIRAYDSLDAFDPYSIDGLLSAHRMLMEDLVKEAGVLRSGNVGVYDGDVLIHAGTPANYVPEVLRDLFTWIKGTEIHPLVASSVFHYELEFIHPFSDGNGRVGRLWQTLLLSRWRDAFAWLPIESSIFSRQKDYYDALAIADERGSSEPFVEFMLEIIRDSLAYWLKSGDRHATQEMDALDFFERHPEARVADLAVALGVSSRTAARIVKNLQESGRLFRVGSNKAGYWQAKNRLLSRRAQAEKEIEAGTFEDYDTLAESLHNEYGL